MVQKILLKIIFDFIMQMIGDMMKKVIINHWMNIIKNEKNYDSVKLSEIKYGLEGLYLTLSKLFIIFTLSVIIGIFKEVLIFLVLYNILRMTSFGIHATKSWICLVSSIIIFIGLPIFCVNFKFELFIKIIAGIFCILLMFKNSPADTKKRPIVNSKRRLIYKIISTAISIVYMIISITIKNNFISNCLIVSMMLQNILISPITYKIFNQPYNNYKAYLKLKPNF